ncbi:MAG: zeta toxin family protein [Ignavibacteriales bacterium]|nr:zeta toxin family protein [Ignavibacteriales bacterium]
MPKIYIISGCNGAGKSTSAYTILPEILNCNEFVNADNIAAGISPFSPDSVAFEAGRIMLQRIDQLVFQGVDLAIETTLSSKSYFFKIQNWQKQGYEIVLIYIWLNSPELALERIADRVNKGGHSIPKETVIRRYYRGINNLFDLFIPVCDYWLIIDNSGGTPKMIAEGNKDVESEVFNKQIWLTIKDLYHEK